MGDAISQLGYDAVYLLAASITGESCLRAAPGTGLDAVMLWKHSVMTAFSAQHVAQAATLDGNMLFTAGLLHDVGNVVFAGFAIAALEVMPWSFRAAPQMWLFRSFRSM